VNRYVVSPRARADLEEIWDYTAERWGIDQAEIYVRLLQDAIETVADDPRKGRPCDDIRAGYRKYAAGSHMLFYRSAGAGGIDVVRILHGGMDFERHL
jgi:toxin ParE1/3/4